MSSAVEHCSRKGDTYFLCCVRGLFIVLELMTAMLTYSSVVSTVGLAQQWDQLDQLGMRMQHNLEQQIQARNQSGVSEDALKEFSMMFKVRT